MGKGILREEQFRPILRRPPPICTTMAVNLFRRTAMEAPTAVVPLIEILRRVPDPRMIKKSEHRLLDVLVIAICAVICGAEHWTEMEEFGECKEKWFRSFLELPNGIPSHDTFGRVFAAIDPQQFRQCYVEWIQGFMQGVDVRHICLDGKTVRGSRHAPASKQAIHMISAYARECGLVLTQEKVNGKGNEVTALPEVLGRLALSGAIVSIDAMGCQKGIACQIKRQGGEYVLGLKGNQSKLAEAVTHHFQCAERDGFALLDHDSYTTLDGDHGRVETRQYDVIGDAEWLDPGRQWGGLAAVGRVRSTRTVKADGSTSTETRYYLLSKRLTAQEFAEASRSHWAIENSLHWVMDVAFGEDACRVHAGHGAENFVMLRHIALGLLKQGTRVKRGIKTRRKVAGWDENYLLELLKGKFHA